MIRVREIHGVVLPAANFLSGLDPAVAAVVEHDERHGQIQARQGLELTARDAEASVTETAATTGADAGTPTLAPHEKQNFASAGSSVPHSAQRLLRASPHPMQNFAWSGFSVLHA